MMPELFNLYHEKDGKKVYVLKNVTADEGNRWYREYSTRNWTGLKNYANGVEIKYERVVT